MPKKKSNKLPTKPVTGKKPSMPVVIDDSPTPEAQAAIRKAKDQLKEHRQKMRDRLTSTTSMGSSAAVGRVTTGFARRTASNIMQSQGVNFFSPQLSPDFLELPQSLREKREWFEFYYNTDPLIGQAVDLLTELPLSRVTLGKPKCKDPKKAEEVLAFYRPMAERLKLLKRLIEIAREYWLMGNTFIFLEDSVEELPDTDEARKSYLGWQSIKILPIEQVQIESYNWGSIIEASYLPSEEEKKVVLAAAQGDENAIKRAENIPEGIKEAIEAREPIPLDTDPDSGSFLYHLARAKSQKQQLGTSILERQLRTLIYRDKLRQAQTSIASRNMTPKRVVYGENLSEHQVEDLREQVDMAIEGPDFTIVTNYPVEWNEIGINDRLLDLSTEWERTTVDLCMGFGLPREVLSGEGSYSGNRIPISIVNERFLLFREMMQEFVEEAIFLPVAKKKGFFEIDEYGNKHYIYPKLKFTRMGLRDDMDTFNNLFNLYQKGSLPISYILELFNIDAEEVAEKLKADFGTFNDAAFNEVIRGAYGEVGRALVEKTNLTEWIAEKLKLEMNEKGDKRF